MTDRKTIVYHASIRLGGSAYHLYQDCPKLRGKDIGIKTLHDAAIYFGMWECEHCRKRQARELAAAQ